MICWAGIYKAFSPSLVRGSASCSVSLQALPALRRSLMKYGEQDRTLSERVWLTKKSESLSLRA
jgi:hypothetical protein